MSGTAPAGGDETPPANEAQIPIIPRRRSRWGCIVAALTVFAGMAACNMPCYWEAQHRALVARKLRHLIDSARSDLRAGITTMTETLDRRDLNARSDSKPSFVAVVMEKLGPAPASDRPDYEFTSVSRMVHFYDPTNGVISPGPVGVVISTY